MPVPQLLRMLIWFVTILALFAGSIARADQTVSAATPERDTIQPAEAAAKTVRAFAAEFAAPGSVRYSAILRESIALAQAWLNSSSDAVSTYCAPTPMSFVTLTAEQKTATTCLAHVKLTVEQEGQWKAAIARLGTERHQRILHACRQFVEAMTKLAPPRSVAEQVYHLAVWASAMDDNIIPNKGGQYQLRDLSPIDVDPAARAKLDEDVQDMLTIMDRHASIKMVGQARETDKRSFTALLKIDGQPLCSGVLIDANTIVTTAHCFCLSGSIQRPDTAFFTAPGRKELSLPISSTVHLFNGELSDCSQATFAPRDIAALRLLVDAPAWAVPFDKARVTGGLSARNVTVIGFGQDDNGKPGRKMEAALRVISSDCGGPLDPKIYHCERGVHFILAPASGRAGPCRGDSGGPVVDAAENLLGLTVGPKPGEGCGHMSRYLRADGDVGAWIEKAPTLWQLQ